MKYLTIIATCGFLFTLSTEAVAQDEETEWRTVERFEGEGQKNTRPFRIDEGMWAVVYDSKSTMGSGAGHIFQVFLKKPQDDLFNEIVANATNKKRFNDNSYIYEQGTFYFQVNAANGEWVIEVRVPGNEDE